MAEGLSLPEEDFTCPVCCDIFRDPVVLKCSHSFCEECLRQYWESQRVPQCPVCRKECSSEEPTKSLAFKSVCESYKSRNQAVRPGDLCTLHEEKLKLFCFEDKQPICVVCHTSKKHKNHECSPIVEAVEDLKTEIKTGVSSLLQNLQALNNVKADYQKLAEHIKDQAQNVEQQVRQEFEKLQQLLREEEAARISALREEEEEKYEKMKRRIEKLTREISTLSETIDVIKQEMEVEDITFLENYNATLNRTQYTLPEPEEFSGALIDATRHLGSLKFTVWVKMQGLFKFSPLTLDPNTASNRLIVSEELTSVAYTEERQPVLDNIERLHVGVLGSQGFNTGCHSWDVWVGNNNNWTVGVVEQSIMRKDHLKLETGNVFDCKVCIVRFIGGRYRAGVEERTELKVSKTLCVIRVQLDCDKGKVTFSNPTKNAILCIFSDTFTEKMFPYFNNASPICPLRLC